MGSLVVSGRSAANWVRKLHAQEEGMETLQIVMILAIAAMVLTGVKSVAGVGTDGSAKSTGLMGAVTTGLGKFLGGSGLGGLGSGLLSFFGG